MPPYLTDILSILLIIFALFAGLAWLLAGQLLRRRSPDPPSTPADFGLDFEHVIFTTRDGLELGGRLTGAGEARPAVIFCAGMFGSMDGDTKMVRPFVEAGFSVLQFDWRGHGISDGRRNTLATAEVQDVIGAIDFLQARGCRKIGLMGFSMGGAVALRAAAADKRAACVVCDGGFARLDHALAGYFKEEIGLAPRLLIATALIMAGWRLGISPLETSPLPVVGQIGPRPVFFIHGAEDLLVPPADQDAVYAACSDPRYLWRLEGAGHREVHEKQPDEYRRRVIDFFRVNL